jgi:hypothetical protein
MDLSRGLMEEDREFLREVLQKSLTPQLSFVLNKLDAVLTEENLLLKGRERVEREIEEFKEKFAKEVKELLGELKKGESFKKENIFLLSGLKGLVGKKLEKMGEREKGRQVLKESRLLEFETSLWRRIGNLQFEKVGQGEKLIKELEKATKEWYQEYLEWEKEMEGRIDVLWKKVEKERKIVKEALDSLNSKNSKNSGNSENSKNPYLRLEDEFVEILRSELRWYLSDLSYIPFT